MTELQNRPKRKKGMKQLEFFRFFIRDENKKIVGGCAGDNMYGCLYVGQTLGGRALRGKVMAPD